MDIVCKGSCFISGFSNAMGVKIIYLLSWCCPGMKYRTTDR